MWNCLDILIIMSSSAAAKCTVREVKKRSKKSRTLPGRLKLLTGGSCTSVNGIDDDGGGGGGDGRITPPPNHHSCSTTGGRRGNKSSGSPNSSGGSKKLSVFKTPEGQHWCFDVDAYGIYMDFNGEFIGRRSLSKDELRPGSVTGGEFMGRDHNDNTSTSSSSTRSKSLTRQSGGGGGSGGGRKFLSTSLSNSTRSMSRTRSRSRLQTMNNSLSQCFGFGSSGHLKKDGYHNSQSGHHHSSDMGDEDSEEYGSDVYVKSVPNSSAPSTAERPRRRRDDGGSSHHLNLDKTFSGSSAFGDLGDDEDRYYPSGGININKYIKIHIFY